VLVPAGDNMITKKEEKQLTYLSHTVKVRARMDRLT